MVCRDIAAGKEVRLTTPATLRVWDELNDVPDLPGSYPAAGWLKDDRALLVSDKYDIWSLDPAGSRPPLNVTVNGRTEGIRYRLLDFDPENDYIDPGVKQTSTVSPNQPGQRVLFARYPQERMCRSEAYREAILSTAPL
jgi:hypothetical protein